MTDNRKAFVQLQKEFGFNTATTFKKHAIKVGHDILMANLDLIYLIYHPNVKHGMSYAKFMEMHKTLPIESDTTKLNGQDTVSITSIVKILLQPDIKPSDKSNLMKKLVRPGILDMTDPQVIDSFYLLEMILDKKSRFNVGKTLLEEYITQALTIYEPNRIDLIEGMKGKDLSGIQEDMREAYIMKCFGQKKPNWMISTKLDGYRALIYVYQGNVLGIYSYNNNPIVTVNKLLGEISTSIVDPLIAQNKPTFVLDMELGVWLKDMSQMFSACTTRVKCVKEDRCADVICFLFDIFMYDETPLKDRVALLNSIVEAKPNHTREFGLLLQEDRRISIVQQTIATSYQELKDYYTKAIELGFEGAMIRNPESIYELTRSSNMLKLKPMSDFEVKVLKNNMGVMSMIDDHGISSEVTCCVSLACITDDGVEFNVGSGLTNKNRIQFMDHNEIVGKTITIRVMGMDKDSKGNIFPRHPRFKAIRED